MHIATISSKRQITLPKDMLEYLNLSFYGKVYIEKKNKTLTLTPIKKSIVEETAGSLYKFIPKDKLNVPFSVVRRETQKKVAEYLVTKK
jgi:bifunctional DNA-binding transcriptional regulator/antitoxin component of YhaV-PrlF toxin-antitoxin module